jgi:hypothetical protein
MKATLLSIILLFTSCWDGEINGKRYKIKWVCTSSHPVMYTTLQSVGKATIPVQHVIYECDEGYYDTIFEK